MSSASKRVMVTLTSVPLAEVAELAEPLSSRVPGVQPASTEKTSASETSSVPTAARMSWMATNVPPDG